MTAAEFPDAADLQLLDEARRRLQVERARVAAFDAVDELATAADAFVLAHLRGQATFAAYREVVDAARRLLERAP